MSLRPASAKRVLSLYRAILRTSRSWQGPEHERKYILDEAHAKFRENQHITSAEEIEGKLAEGESRLALGVHYQIPYPRLHHQEQHPHHHLTAPKVDFGEVPASKNTSVGAKLKAAAARRKAKLQQELASMKDT